MDHDSYHISNSLPMIPCLSSFYDPNFLSLLLIVVTTSTLLLVLVDYIHILVVRRTLPPGPFPFPLIGNHLQIPNVKPWLQFSEWSRQYSNPLITIWLGRNPTVVVNDAWSAAEIMEKRATIYSSRPRMVAMGDMTGGTDTNQVCLVYGDKWRAHRKLTHAVVGSQNIQKASVRAAQSNETKVLTRDLLLRPDDYVPAIERYSCSVVSILGWGRRIDRINDYVAQQALAVMEGVDLIIPGLFWMETLPWLTNLPSWIYKLPSSVLATSSLLGRYFYALSAEEGARTDKPDNFAKRLIAEQRNLGLRDSEVANLTANLIGGGVDTTSSTMISFILAMCVFPSTQHRAQAELDAVLGDTRSPDWSDIDGGQLPYTSALVEEALRWRTVTILGGIPHAPTQDDEFRGYHIPAGTPITGNIWAIHRDEKDFPDPDRFEPDRFLGGSWRDRTQVKEAIMPSVGDEDYVVDNRWPVKDENGNEIKLDIGPDAYTDSENTRPKLFKARFIPRSEKIRALILQEAETARGDLKVYDGETKLRLEQF